MLNDIKSRLTSRCNIIICIPTYKNRYAKLIEYINTIVDRYDVMICFSTYDDHLEEYDQYDLDDRIIKLYSDAKTIGGKKQHILDHLHELGYRYVLMMDDDLEDYYKFIDETTKRTTSNSYRCIKAPLVELIDELYNVIKKNDATIVSPCSDYVLGFVHTSVPGVIWTNRRIKFGQCVLYNIDNLYEYGIKFIDDPYVHDDVIVGIECLRNGLKCLTLGYASVVPIRSSNNIKNSVVYDSSYTNDLMRLDMYVRYRDGIIMRLNRKGDLSITMKQELFDNTKELYIKTDEYHQELYELCKKKDVEAVKKYIYDKRYKNR